MPSRLNRSACRYSGKWSAYLSTITWAIRALLAIPLSITRSCAGACTMRSQALQLYLGRTSLMGRYDIKQLRGIFTDSLHRLATIRTITTGRFLLLNRAWQMGWQDRKSVV